MRKTLIIILTFLGGLYYFLEFYLPDENMLLGRHLTEWNSDIGDVVAVVSAFAVFLGMINLMRAHSLRIMRLRPGWHNSVATLVTIVLMFGAIAWAQMQTQAGYGKPTGSLVERMAYGEFWEKLLFDAIRAPLDATVFALLAFYIASAAYRAFRVRSVEATLMMGVAFFVMLGQMPWAAQFTEPLRESATWSWADLTNIKEWIKDVWNSAAQRGILFGVMIGTLAMSIRIWLSLERGSFFEDEF